MTHSTILSANEQYKLLEIIYSLTQATEISQFKHILSSLGKLVGFKYIIFGMPELTSNGETSIIDLNISYPQEWVDLYQTNEFWRIDPIVLAATKTTEPHNWADIYHRCLPDKKFRGLAQDYGLINGYTCLARSRTGQKWTIVSMAGDFPKKTHRLDFILERITPHLHCALDSIMQNNKKSPVDNLTARQKEVLSWLYEGKTSWEISVILEVSENTINFHVKNIKSKLNVVSRAQAVAVAIHNGLIGM